jgi:hypothetical protein
VPTPGAGLAGFARVNEDNGDAAPRSLVFDLIHQIAECPTRHHAVEALRLKDGGILCWPGVRLRPFDMSHKKHYATLNPAKTPHNPPFFHP